MFKKPCGCKIFDKIDISSLNGYEDAANMIRKECENRCEKCNAVNFLNEMVNSL
jgi:hypothetical protein